jgi:hypothetical protein
MICTVSSIKIWPMYESKSATIDFDLWPLFVRLLCMLTEPRHRNKAFPEPSMMMVTAFESHVHRSRSMLG